MQQRIPADSDDVAAQTERLEAALDRIAAASAWAFAPAQATSVDVGMIAARLDTTIARLKAAIGEA